MADSDFWRKQSEKFHSLPDPDGLLGADWIQIAGSNLPFQWSLRTTHVVGNTRTVRVQFEALARRCGSEIDRLDGRDLLDCWLDALKKDIASDSFSRTSENIDGEPKIVIHGRINRICAASADFCNILESRALESEATRNRTEAQSSDPKNWPPLVQEYEAFKAIKNLITGPHEEIRESLVRSLIAQHSGIPAGEISPKQLRFEIAGLLQRYPAIKIIPDPPGEASSSKKKRRKKKRKRVLMTEIKPAPPESTKPARASGKIDSMVAATRMTQFISKRGMTQPQFAEKAKTTDRTIRSFSKTGKVRKDIFRDIAYAMGTTQEDLLASPEPRTGK